MAAHRAVLSQLQVAYVAALGGAGPAADDGPAGNEAGDPAAEGGADESTLEDSASDGSVGGDDTSGGGAG